jgi:glycosyltransferase involved in cell wall biosynthesis
LKLLTLTSSLRISCIIPTRNRPDYVSASAASVLGQSHRDLELIIVNDGTTPVPVFADPRVHILNSGEAGAVPARNLGAAAATGDAIAWLDDDDQWTDEHFLESCITLFEGGSDFVFGDGALVFPDGVRRAFAKAADAKSLENDNTILISSVCYRRNLHDQLGMFDAALPYYWDWDWYLRVARAGRHLTRFAQPVVDIRIHENNMSGTANAEKRAANLQQFCAKHGLENLPLKSHVDFV